MSHEKEYIKLELSLKSQEEQIISNVQKEIIQEDLNRFSHIKENDMNISTSYIFDDGENLEASIFLRNGLNTKVNFDIVPLSLVDDDGRIIAYQVFRLIDLGDIPPFSARPYKLYFNKKNLQTNKFDIQKLKVMFSEKIKAVNTVKVEYEDMPQDLSLEERQFFQNYLDSLSLLELGQVDLKCYDIRLKEDNIKVTILVRNGASKKIKLEELPITLYDGDKNILYSSVLKFSDLTVNSMKAKLCNFMIGCNDLNLDKFNVKGLSAKLSI